MIETMKIENADVMTARDWALHEFLLAFARNSDIVAEWHSVDMTTVTKFLEVDENPVTIPRVRECLKRITHTMLTYDFRSEFGEDGGTIPMIIANIHKDLLVGTAVIHYSIPLPVREAILDANVYAMLQLNVLPLFKCRYSGRLYQRFAYFSFKGKRWEIEPTKLAEALNFPMEDGKLHFTSFMRRCLEPALAEIDEHVGQFKVKLVDTKRGSGRGRTVEKLIFDISKKEQRIDHTQATHLSQREMDVIGLPDAVLQSHELPGTFVVGRAVTATGISATTLAM